jgi:hypothetical protein
LPGLTCTYQVAAVGEYARPAVAAELKPRGTLVVKPYAYLIQGYESRVYFPGALFALVVAAGLAGILMPSRRSGAAVLLWASAAITIVLPSAEHMDNYRYALPAIPLACMALALVLNGRKVVGGPLRAPEPETLGRNPTHQRIPVA